MAFDGNEVKNKKQNSGEKKTVKYIIYHEYIKAALLPILLVELMLLVMYFTITSYVESSTKETLLNEAKANISEISMREAKNINQQIAEISLLSEMLQKENSRVFQKPAAFTLPSTLPVMGKWKNGVTYKLQDNGGSSVWYSSITPFTDLTMKKVIQTEAMDPMFKVVLESNDNIVGIYFNANDSMCRYYPFLPEVYNVFEPTMDIPLFNFYYLADQEHNPGGKSVWTDVYLDPAGQGWMASCITPIYNNEKVLEGVTGIDITVDKMVQNILNLKLPWNAGAFLVDQNGVILAMPESIESALNLKELRAQVYESTVKQDTLKPEEFNLFKNEDLKVVEQIKDIWINGDTVNEFTIGDKRYFLTQGTITETGWRLMMLVDQDIVLEPIMVLDQLTKRTGFIAFSLMVVFYAAFFSYLMYKSKKVAENIAEPIVQIAHKTSEMMVDVEHMHYVGLETDIEEIDLLSNNFAVMATELKAFSEEMESKVKHRTIQLTEMYEELEASKEELEKANMQIIHQEKMASIGQLAAGVAHEINNPMGFIISNISQMKKYAAKLFSYMEAHEKAIEEISKLDLSHESFEMLRSQLEEVEAIKNKLDIDFLREDVGALIDDTLEGTNRVKVIVQELRTFSRNDVQKSMADLNVGIDSVINIIWNELKYKVNLVKDYGDIPMTYCNIGQLNQVFMNILLNAAHAIEENGEIGIKTRCEENQIIMEISDTGHGIPPEIINKIFDPFFTTKEIGKGTGLGLSISYEIVKSYGGNVVVESRVGAGTKFVISIPVVENSPQS